ncbi:MAG: hemolysin III family protein [Woeseiaceae bacterium]|nr:hemolysin III family protein [Woeseiaceae bacterium]
MDYSVKEEVFHAVSHGAGVLLSVAGLSWMLYISIVAADPWRISASIVYGLCLLLLFLASTVYHALHASEHKHIYKLLDHCAIYLMIAGTYTPFILVAMRNPTGWWLFGAIWTLAAFGIVSKIWLRHRFPKLAMASYLVMGWLVVIAAPELADAVGSGGIAWLVAGGIAYTVGALFYSIRSMRFNHAIWHVFVLVGGICHFLAVALHVLPVPGAVGIA